MPNLMDALSKKDTKLQTPGLQKSTGGGATPNGELMRQAREALEGNWAMAVVGDILYLMLVVSVAIFVFAIAWFSTGISAVSDIDLVLAIKAVCGVLLVLSLLQGALLVGFCSFFLVIVQDNETRLECLFTGFKRFWKAFGAYFFCTLFMFLWIFSALLIPLLLLVALSFIPVLDSLLTHKNIAIISLLVGFLSGGLVAALRYAMVYFVLADDPSAGPIEAIRRSKEMMKGNKWKFFCLQWRFFGWALLCPLTCGVGYLWLIPYMQTTMARFYEDVK